MAAEPTQPGPAPAEGETAFAPPVRPEKEELQDVAMAALEYPRVLQILAAKTRFFLAADMAHALAPSSDPERVERLQEETAEAARLLDTSGDIGLAGSRDPRPLMRRAALGGTLSGQELLNVAYLFEATWSARRAVETGRGQYPLLSAIAVRIPDLRDLKTEMLKALSQSGEVLDSATPRLGPLRQQAAAAYQRLRNSLERMASDPNVRGALQSTAVATRGDRLVLEVKIERRKAVPGIVHDVSQTGMTIFVEPFQAVERCNEWRETAAEAEREEDRVLRRLSRVLGDREQHGLAAVNAAGELDFIAARARLARSMDANRAGTLTPGPGLAARLSAARHPLLGPGAVPVSLHIGPDFRGLVITGPNTGGKTVALKTLGLLALMHQSGLHLPAEDGTAFAVFDAVYADIGDAQSIERSVSTFSSHLGNVVRILRNASDRSLVLLDELGTGTDPEEGSALARAVLESLVASGVPCAITTHHRSVAEFAGSTQGMRNASVELNPDTMLPTYHVVMGAPGRSYAMHVAGRLGLPQSVLDRARSYIDPRHREAESLLSQLQRERAALHRASISAQDEHIEAEATRRELQARLAQVQRQQEDLVERTRMELRREAEEVRHHIQHIVSQAKEDANIAAARAAVNRLRQELSGPTWFPITPQEAPSGESPRPVAEARPIGAGDSVEIKGLNVRAEVLGVDQSGNADLQMGGVRIQLNVGQLRRMEGAPDSTPSRTPVSVRTAGPSEPVNPELDMRGARAIEAHDLVTAFLDRCQVAGLTRCRILHGTGTGALREAVRQTLSASAAVSSFAPANQSEGGNGVTAVELL